MRKKITINHVLETPPATPAPFPHTSSPSLHSNGESSSSSEGPKKYKSLTDLYEVTERLEDNTFLFFLFSDIEPMNFDQAKRHKEWNEAMNAEINAIKKNKT